MSMPIEIAIQHSLYNILARRRMGLGTEGEIGQGVGDVGEGAPAPARNLVLNLVRLVDDQEIFRELLSNASALQLFLKRLQRSEYGVEMVKRLTSLLARHANRGNARAQEALERMVDFAPGKYQGAISKTLSRLNLSALLDKSAQQSPTPLSPRPGN